MTDLFFIFMAFFLVLMNAFFVAAEFGMVKLRHTRVMEIKDIYGLRGRILANVHKNLDAYLSACQLGITLASLGLGWIGEPAFTYFLEPFLQFFGIFSKELVKTLSILFAFVIITFLHIVIGELMPKSLAIRQSEPVSIWTAIPLYGFYWLTYPAIWVLNSCSNFLLNLTGLAETHHGDNTYSAKEIKLILNSSHVHGGLTKEEMQMLEHTLDFAELKVAEIMRPHEEMVMLNIADSMPEIMKVVMEYKYSRFPIYCPDKQEIIGIIHVKDLFSTLYHQGEITALHPLIRPVLKVHTHLPVLHLMNKFREGMPHFGLVYNHSEVLLGFVTLDNLLNVIIGRIKDEFNKTKDNWTICPNGSLVVRGDCSLYSLEKALGCHIYITKDEEDIETITGLIRYRLDRLPLQGETVDFREFSVVIEKAQRNRMQQLIIWPKKITDNDGESL